MPFGLICIPSIAGFCVKYVARQNYSNVSDDTVQMVKQDFYVDDFITSVSTIEDAKRVVTESTKLLATTGFSLTKFACNNREILQCATQDQVSPPFKAITISSKEVLPEQKILGLVWNTENDMLEIRKTESVSRINPSITRRKALSQMNSYFDPLGLWCPFMLKLKLCYSHIVKQTQTWDDLAPPELQRKWNEVVLEMEQISSSRYPVTI